MNQIFAKTALLPEGWARDVLVTLAAPNDGIMTTVGSLGVNTTGDVGFDIAGNNGAAYVTLRSSSSLEHCANSIALAASKK